MTLVSSYFRRLPRPGNPGLIYYISFWLLLGFGLSCKTYLTLWSFGGSGYMSFSDALSWQLPACILFGLLAPFVGWLNRHFPFKRKALPVLVHAVSSLLFGLVHSFLQNSFAYYFSGFADSYSMSYGSMAFFLLVLKNINILVYWFILGGFIALDALQRSRASELKAAVLQARLAEAQLESLRNQLQPHFLFNTLNIISALIYRDAALADQMICRLSDLLRITLENSAGQLIPLREELRFLDSYVDIMRCRFQERLQVEMQIDPATLDLPVPALLLQPLVENAILHGELSEDATNYVRVLSRRGRSSLRFEISDSKGQTGGCPQDWPSVEKTAGKKHQGHGIGLSNTRKRLQQLYGSDYRFLQQQQNRNGMRITIKLPVAQGA